MVGQGEEVSTRCSDHWATTTRTDISSGGRSETKPPSLRTAGRQLALAPADCHQLWRGGRPPLQTQHARSQTERYPN